jgi:hypothetical protein
MAKKTLKRRRQRGGNEQLQHAVSQLKRFALRASEGKPFKSLQFGYNLGRLQEMVDGGKEKMNEYYWKPIEPLVEKGEWAELIKVIDRFLEEKVKGVYDEATLKKD